MCWCRRFEWFKLFGPALGDVTERRELDWLLKWIKDNQALRNSGDKQAQAIFEEYNGSVMTAFPNLSDQDIKDVLVYTQEGGKKEAETTADGGGAVAAVDQEEDNTRSAPCAGSVAVFLIVLLVRVKNTLDGRVKG
ncbi:MAG: cytochrome c [Owenweeksia sp.]|nr:cytochrome c [Owenweeksia sp.]